MRQPKIVIVGAGLVGGSAALFAAVTIPSAEIWYLPRHRATAVASLLAFFISRGVIKTGNQLNPILKNVSCVPVSI